MSKRLTTAVRMGIGARQILNKTRTFPDAEVKNPFAPDGGHIGVEPMLLALSMELALKAWYVFDHDSVPRRWTHDLAELFDSLTEGSWHKLDSVFKASIVPFYPNFLFADYGIRHLLLQHNDAFVRWRYLHEGKPPRAFDQGVFEATLEMVVVEFEKLYCVEKLGRPPLSRPLP